MPLTAREQFVVDVMDRIIRTDTPLLTDDPYMRGYWDGYRQGLTAARRQIVDEVANEDAQEPEAQRWHEVIDEAAA